MDLSVLMGFLISTIVQFLTPPKTGSEILKIPQGTLEGYRLTSRNGREFKAFTGIPYGRPPVGRLRFKDPLPAEPWEGVLSAKRNVRCVDYQAVQPWSGLRTTGGQEDCLTLNVYTHDTSPGMKRPVLFYIHGGSFEFRVGPMIYFQPTYFMDHDMVVVTINYRLSALGFLSFEDDVVPGNMGLKDQNLALRWAYENIAHFGGDPDRITLMGESAGSVSCQYHAVMPKSRNMVSQVILQSGSTYGTWGLEAPGNAKRKALRIAELTGCKRSTSRQTLECLQSVDPYKLVKTADHFRTWWDRDPLILFHPVIEKPAPGAFITDFPYNWPPLRVPALMGVDEEDGLLRSAFFKLDNYDFDYVSRNLDAFLPPSLMFDGVNSTSDPAASSRKIIDFYLNGRRNVTAEDERIFSEMYSDCLFRWPLYLTAKNSENKMYIYVNGFKTRYVYIIKDRVFHVQEVLFLWEPEIMPNRLVGEDRRFSQRIVDWWSNFVINGNPNKPDEEQLWEPSKTNSLDFLYIRQNGTAMVTGFYEEAMRFWNDESGVIDRFRINPQQADDGEVFSFI